LERGSGTRVDIEQERTKSWGLAANLKLRREHNSSRFTSSWSPTRSGSDWKSDLEQWRREEYGVWTSSEARISARETTSAQRYLDSEGLKLSIFFLEL